MSKWILFPGLACLLAGSVMFLLRTTFLVFFDWYWPVMQIGIVGTIVGSAMLIFRGDW